jgi:DNA mismatch endonuclease, patch repair protein
MAIRRKQSQSKVVLERKRSENMRAIRGKDTVPELTLRSALHKIGYRYRLHASELPGVPDLLLPRFRTAVFVNGCFWHRHRCARGRRVPKTNTEYWLKKLSRNTRRDRLSIRKLRALGWHCLTIWECELRKSPAIALNRAHEFLQAANAASAAVHGDKVKQEGPGNSHYRGHPSKPLS